MMCIEFVRAEIGSWPEYIYSNTQALLWLTRSAPAVILWPLPCACCFVRWCKLSANRRQSVLQAYAKVSACADSAYED